ncbi:MAG: sarcosine oxidase subunit beta family protein [Gammaproteobacteria bacterium]|nr:MAG: sarcosine oxidase subunit beta family protein [Gammaproteobacteria bacterium]
MTMARYSLPVLFGHALSGHRHWPRALRCAESKAAYDALIVGGGGHGLATAYFLAARHGMRNIAVLDKGAIGHGNSGRNTQVVRSDYFHLPSSRFFERSLRLYEGLSRELNYNVMLSQRGKINLAHSPHDLEVLRRATNAIRMNGVDAELLSVDELRRLEPALNLRCRYPIEGGAVQWRGGIARHDAVVWAFARAAGRLGVDLIQGCEVTGFLLERGRVTGVETTRGRIAAPRVCLAVAGHSSVLARRAGLELPLNSMALQAMVTEPVKPLLNTVLLSPAIHVYLSQSDRGEVVIGGGADIFHSYAQRGGLPVLEANAQAAVELFPALSRLRVMRQWAGIVDISPDTSPIMGLTPVAGLYLNAGWGTGGFKAIPAGGETMAWTMAHDRPHELITSFGLERFTTGALVDEGAASGVAH